jgi:predicted Rossmann-fold nucleotide-binding protein
MSNVPAAVDAVNRDAVSIHVSPRGALEMLSQLEVDILRRVGTGSAAELFRRCALAVLNTGNETDDATAIFAQHSDFAIEITQRTRGVRLRIENAPSGAFVEGRMIEGIKEHLFAVLRDVVFIATELRENSQFDLGDSRGITNAVFHVLRNAGALQQRTMPNVAVCWGGHAIGREEYDYSKQVGYQLGLRGVDVCTGCGPGAMKGPMKGAAVGHAKQRNQAGRYIGISEPGIIASEPPNPMVNELVVMPDIEKRLEAFLRLGHAIVVFPGGAGTAEEILYLLGLLLLPENAGVRLPVVITAPASSRDWVDAMDEFLVASFGDQVRQHYQVIVDDPAAVGHHLARELRKVRRSRLSTGDAFYFNWLLHVPLDFQQPFVPTHARMAALDLSRDRPVHELAADLRRAFSGIVAGNVKDAGIRQVSAQGPWQLRGDSSLMAPLDALLRRFAEHGRMKLSGRYAPCYEITS